MTYLVRRTNRNAWSGAATVTNEQRAGARTTFLRKDEDTDGVSVFEVSDETNERVVVAAIALSRRPPNESAIDLLPVELEEAAQFGPVNPTPELGRTPVACANRLHRSLDWSQDRLNALADLLLEHRRTAIHHGRADVRAAVSKLDPGEMAREDAREFVSKLRGREQK